VGTRLQGIFLEGPFFTEKHKGAQNSAYLIDPSAQLLDDWQEAAGGLIRKSAFAPERAGATAYAAACCERGVVAALGHSDATYREAIRAVEAGASVFVHTYNGMRGFTHREPGMVGAALATDGTYCEAICDGVHSDLAAIKVLVRARGWEHVVPISDCLRCGGMPDGSYTLGELPIRLEGSSVWVVDEAGERVCLAGSATTLLTTLHKLVEHHIVTAEQALRMGTEIAARSAGIDDVCGSIRRGRDADLVVLDSDLSLVATYLGGVRVV
jgi:N-acetylglucosamine-6-phosphate deacetylase